VMCIWGIETPYLFETFLSYIGTCEEITILPVGDTQIDIPHISDYLYKTFISGVGLHDISNYLNKNSSIAVPLLLLALPVMYKLIEQIACSCGGVLEDGEQRTYGTFSTLSKLRKVGYLDISTVQNLHNGGWRYSQFDVDVKSVIGIMGLVGVNKQKIIELLTGGQVKRSSPDRIEFYESDKQILFVDAPEWDLPANSDEDGAILDRAFQEHLANWITFHLVDEIIIVAGALSVNTFRQLEYVHNKLRTIKPNSRVTHVMTGFTGTGIQEENEKKNY